jgi:hypothetical protein
MASATDSTFERTEPPLDAAPTHPHVLAFVIRLHRASDASTHRLCGRVEHVASGRRAEFRDVAELQGWLEAQLDGADRA